MNTVMTIGYEGATVEDFVATLAAAGIDMVVDVRDVPVSRKRGFSKTVLSELLAARGFQYLHLKALGDPKEGRDAAKRGDLTSFQRIFGNHLKTREAQTAIQQALDEAARLRICLLCYERDHKYCHRAMVVDEMKHREDLEIRHLGVRHGLAKERREANLDAGYGIALR